MTSTSKPINIVSLSDIHLGHLHTKTDFILANLVAYLYPKLTPEVDLLIFAGDVFDRLLSFPSEEVSDICHWIYVTLSICSANDTDVELLEGTPGHDYKQSRIFVAINNMLPKPARLKYVDTLSIERNEKLGLDILYVPDRWTNHADDTWKQVTSLLSSKGLDKVDIAIMHGAFEYQIPKSNETHSEERYLGIVRHFIFIGHVHIYSTYADKIISHGSFDRTGHAYETPKGFVHAIIDRGTGTNSHTFVENMGAKLYLTHDISKLEVDEVFSRYNEEVEYPAGSHLRVQVTREQALGEITKKLAASFPQWKWKQEIIGEEKVSKIKPDIVLPKALIAREYNIREILNARLGELSQEVSREIEVILDEVV